MQFYTMMFPGRVVVLLLLRHASREKHLTWVCLTPLGKCLNECGVSCCSSVTWTAASGSLWRRRSKFTTSGRLCEFFFFGPKMKQKLTKSHGGRGSMSGVSVFHLQSTEDFREGRRMSLERRTFCHLERTANPPTHRTFCTRYHVRSLVHIWIRNSHLLSHPCPLFLGFFFCCLSVSSRCGSSQPAFS